MRARNVHRLNDIGDKSGNDMARVQAVKTLEQMADAAGADRLSARTALVGYQSNVSRAASASQPADAAAPAQSRADNAGSADAITFNYRKSEGGKVRTCSLA
jgi:hypothetical protein